MATPLLSIKNLSVYKSKNDPIFSDISFEVNEGDVLVLQGRSGGGKTTLMKALAHMNVYQGEVLLRGQPPSKYGIPTYRTRVLYVPQRPSLLPANPRHFLHTINGFASRKQHKDAAKTTTEYGAVSPQHFVDESGVQLGADPHDPFALAKQWGLEEAVWDRDWSNLSGGEAQRVLLAIAAGLKGTEVLLLDEPTSALDSETSSEVEKTLTNLPKSGSTIKAIVWITHSHEQGERVGTRWLNLNPGHGLEESDSTAYHTQNGSAV
ncbi:ABC transporter [Ceratobasidium sp. AG-Ba]|nr:ABC transporter [Ceratobasidium sp. AG-Ba]QRW14329.1 ABC transporter [Ceratobasidium sp. AG-Ba]